MGMRMTKMPGGGLEFGEGVEAALKREWVEELGIEIEVGDIFFVNPFLQISAFDENEEVLAMYFEVNPTSFPLGRISERAFDFVENGEDQQSFRWIDLEVLRPEDFTFPIDKAMCEKLLLTKAIRSWPK